MALSGTRKAALLLSSLDARTAADLLKSASPQTVTEIAAEIAYLAGAKEEKAKAASEMVQELSELFQKKKSQPGQQQFIQELLGNLVGDEQSRGMLAQVQELVRAKDPFAEVRSMGAADIARALQDESPKVVALVMSELSPKSSAELLQLLDEEVRLDAIRSMAAGTRPSTEVRMRIAGAIRQRLSQTQEAAGGAGETEVAPAAGQDQQFRKVALLLRDVRAEFRTTLLAAIEKQDADVGKAVKDLMVIWEDIPTITTRSLADALRSVDGRQMAMALHEADETVSAKIRTSISERAVALLDEEISLLSTPKGEEVAEARQAILEALRELIDQGELNFEEQ